MVVLFLAQGSTVERTEDQLMPIASTTTKNVLDNK